MKKKLRPVLFIILLAGISHTALAQRPPGYMGKRLSIHYTPQMNYGFLVKQFDVQHQASLEYVTSLKALIGFRYGFANLIGEYDYEQIVNTYYGSEIREMNRDVHYRVHAFSFYGKFFSKKRGFIAPMGPYTGVGITVIYANAVAREDFVYDETDYLKGDKIVSDVNFGIFVEKGRSFIIADKLILNIGGQLTAPFIWRLVTDDPKRPLNKRVGLASIFGVKIGLGYLAF